MWSALALAVMLHAAANVEVMPAQDRSLRVSYDAAANYRPILHVGAVLGDRELERAALAGVPVRIRVRVELWKDRLFDALVDSTTWSLDLYFEPISEQFFIRSTATPGRVGRYTSFAAARRAVETEFSPRIQPRERGRYYYTALLQIETLSVSDLEELERWLQGELQPAVSGERSVPGAVGQGLKRLLLRALDLPAHRHDARTARFVYPG